MPRMPFAVRTPVPTQKYSLPVKPCQQKPKGVSSVEGGSPNTGGRGEEVVRGDERRERGERREWEGGGGGGEEEVEE